jgi:hypothetical protein
MRHFYPTSRARLKVAWEIPQNFGQQATVRRTRSPQATSWTDRILQDKASEQTMQTSKSFLTAKRKKPTSPSRPGRISTGRQPGGGGDRWKRKRSRAAARPDLDAGGCRGAGGWLAGSLEPLFFLCRPPLLQLSSCSWRPGVGLT